MTGFNFAPLSPYVHGKRVSVVAIGGSVPYGLGLDQTQNYYSLMQARVDASSTTGANFKGGWTARYVHDDDLQPGNITFSSPNVLAPFNGSNNLFYSVPNYGNGVYVGGGSLKNLNPQGGYLDTPGGGTSKINLDATAATIPTAGARGIFNPFGGYKTPLNSTSGQYTNPSTSLTTTNQNIRFCGNVCTYLLLGIIGTGTAHVYTSWSGAYAWTIGGGNATSITQVIVQFGWSAATTFAAGQPVIASDNNVYTSVAGGNVGHDPTAGGGFWSFVGPVSAGNNANGVQTMSIFWASGTIDIAMIWPGRLQNTTDVLFQICARNSYCLQDFLATDAGTGTYVPTLIQQGVINQPSYVESGPPVFIVVDSYNSMVTGDIGGSGDRRLDPSTYAAQLTTLGKALQTGGAFTNARIIVEMPCVPNLTTFNGAGTPNGGLAWLTGAWGASVPNVAAAYRSKIAGVARANKNADGSNWGFIDQSVVSGSTGSVSGFYQDGSGAAGGPPGGFHPAPAGALQIANYNIGQFGL